MEIHVYSTLVYVQVGREERQPTQTKLTMNMHVYTRTPTTKLTTHLRTQGCPALNWNGGLKSLLQLANSLHIKVPPNYIRTTQNSLKAYKTIYNSPLA